MNIITLKNIEKRYKQDIVAVKDFTLDIAEGEFIALLGPSGCGKTTTLRMIAGLETITSGELTIQGEVANDTRPDKRNLAMVFQDYALIPHMTVYENIAYPLKVIKTPKDVIKEEVEKAIDMVNLAPYVNKKTGELSGGQRQRVALARALVKKCNVVLMDEPLSNLDVELRAKARTDIMKFNKEFNRTVIYVTHDQIEAMTMADRIVVMKLGEVQQIGTSKEIYHTPANEFVAKFIGNPGMNILEQDEVLNLDDVEQGLKIGIRPENISVRDSEEGANFIGKVINLEDFGNDIILYISNGKVSIKVRVPNTVEAEIGKEYCLKFKPDEIKLFDAEGKLYGNFE